MTKISNQYSLTNILTADLANSRLGINNVSPTVALDVTGAGKFSSSLLATSYNATTTNIFAVDGTERMRITSAGNVGINTTSPNAQLHIVGNSTSELTSGVKLVRSEQAGQYIVMNYESGIANFTAVDSTFSAPAFRFNTSTNGTTSTERIRITSAGNVGIGTNTPTDSIIGSGKFLDIASTSGGGLKLHYTDATALGELSFYKGSNGSYIDSAGAATLSNNNLIFRTGATASNYGVSERMRILSNGDMCIGMTASPYSRLSIKSNSTTRYAGFAVYAPANGNFIYMNHDNNAAWIGADTDGTGPGATTTPLLFATSDLERMRISINGSIGAGGSTTNIYNASDARLKQNISTLTYGLDKIKALNPVKFNWADGFEPNEANKTLLGFIAQEVNEVIPEAIESFGGSVDLNGTIIDNTLRVNEKFIIPVLVKAIQELSAKVSLLENK